MKLIVTIFLCVLFQGSFAQPPKSSIIKDCKLLPQLRENWCWAASIQMIDKFLNPSNPVKQCEIVQNYYIPILQRRPNFPHEVVYRCCENIECNNSIVSSNQVSSDEDGNFPLNNRSDYRTVLSKMGYESKQTNIFFSWNFLKNQIETKKPFIIGGIEQIGVSNVGSHAVVANGYYENSNFRLIHINDPWKVCEGCSYYISYDLYACKRSDFTCAIESPFLKITYDIKRSASITTSPLQDIDTQADCKLNINDNLQKDSISIVKDFIKLLVKDNNSEFLSETGLKGITQNEIDKVFALSTETVSNDDIIGPTKTKEKSKCIYILNRIKSTTIIVLEKSKQNCGYTIESISSCKWIGESLNNKPKETISVLSFQPYGYLFYLKNNNLLLPFENYPRIGVVKNKTYSREEILDKLKTIIKQ